MNYHSTFSLLKITYFCNSFLILPMYSNLRFKNQLLYQVGPQAIYVVGRDDDDESIAAGSDGSNDAASWETVEDDTDSINHPEVNGY